ncbi:DUF4232 domain-containing protein [Actinoplanes sp. NPDC051494]|uniref:DUF4232 domain-containing protein n=1 Tax=Actinoplanes sp. NPDC051494 TaxID=3363907 RepID=UPI0037B43ACE
MRVPVLAMAVGIAFAAGGSGLVLHNASAAEASTVPGAAGTCAVADVAADVQEGDMYDENGEFFEKVRLTFTNTSAAACVIDGHPSVVLTGPATGSWRESFRLPETGAPARVTLAAGESAHASVRVRVLPEAPSPWQPEQMRVRLTGAAGHLMLQWPAGLAIQQDTYALPGAGLPNSVESVVAGA